MRLVVADCSIDYAGRLTAHLPMARRLIIVKADGTVVVHADQGHKALNWMSPPCAIAERPDGWTVTGAKGETLDIAIAEIHADIAYHLGREPGLLKTGSEAELQMLLAQQPEVIEAGARLIQREYPTDLGPVDLLLRSAADETLVVEVKRVAELAAVEQLSRYLERLDGLGSMRGILVAQTIKPQTRVLAEARGIGCVEVDFEMLAGRAVPDLTLF
ncbi:MAG TPA: endonuclease NucS [Actinomycetota bacterium]